MDFYSVKERLPKKGKAVLIKVNEKIYVGKRIGFFENYWKYESGLKVKIHQEDEYRII